MSDTERSEAEGGEPSAPQNEPQPGEPTADPEPTGPEPTAPEGSAPEAAEPEPAESKAAEPESAEPKAAEPEPAEPKAAEPKAAEPEPAEPEVSARKKVDWIRRGLLAVSLLVFLVVMGPWLISSTFLTASLRSTLQAALGESAGLSGASMGWKSGFRLDGVLIDDPPPGVPRVVLETFHLDSNLVNGLNGLATGNEIRGRLVIRKGRFELSGPFPLSEEAPSDEPGPEPTPGSDRPLGLQNLPDLPAPIRAQFLFEQLDFVLGWAAEGNTPLKLLIMGLNGQGGGVLSRDLALDLDESIDMTLDEVVLETHPADGPTETVLWIEKPRFQAERLLVPSPRLLSPLTATTSLRLEVPRIRAGDVEITGVLGTATLAAGLVDLGFAASLPVGKLKQGFRIDLRDDSSWPVGFNISLDAVGLEGDLARLVPYLIPLLLAADTPTGPGLPPLSLELEVNGALGFDGNRAVAVKDSLNSLAGKGTFAIGAGSLANSKLIDGYAKALVGLGVGGLLDGILPTNLEFAASEGSFELSGGKVTLPPLELRSDALGLVLSGETRFDGGFRVNLKSLAGAPGPSEVQAVLSAINDAGGITLEGSILDGSVTAVLPDKAQLLAAAQAHGVLDSLQEATGVDLPDTGVDLPGGLGDVLGGLKRDK